MTLSVAALITFGSTPGIVKKSAELLNYGRLGRPDYGRHHTEARAGECLMTWGYQSTFGKGRLFVFYSVIDEAIECLMLGCSCRHGGDPKSKAWPKGAVDPTLLPPVPPIIANSRRIT